MYMTLPKPIINWRLTNYSLGNTVHILHCTNHFCHGPQLQLRSTRRPFKSTTLTQYFMRGGFVSLVPRVFCVFFFKWRFPDGKGPGTRLDNRTGNISYNCLQTLTLSYTGGGGGGESGRADFNCWELWWNSSNCNETRWLFLKFIADYIFGKKKLIRRSSVSVVTVLSKVLFGSFVFMHIFCYIFHIFRFICAYYQSGRYIFIISHWNN